MASAKKAICFITEEIGNTISTNLIFSVTQNIP